MDLITVTRKSGLVFEYKVREHTVASDMSVSDGGTGAAPSPAELLAGALGACIAMTVQSYCDSNGYTGGDVGVSLTFEFADSPKRVGAITVDVELPDGVPEARREAIRNLIARCPIQETLNKPPRVDVDFA
jgi:putative redox protein